MSKHNAIDKALMKQAETACGFDSDMFADLIRADEREACAKVCESLRDEAGINSGRVWSSACAAAIRARSET